MHICLHLGGINTFSWRPSASLPPISSHPYLVRFPATRSHRLRAHSWRRLVIGKFKYRRPTRKSLTLSMSTPSSSKSKRQATRPAQP
eukprot:scaffold62347_cov28-Tisochrysis_lutea.AAC.4